MWEKGTSGNPNGRPKKPVNADLLKALKKLSRKKGKSFLEHVAEQAFVDNNVAMAVLNKLIPNLKQLEVSGEFNGDVGLHIKSIPQELLDLINYDKG